MLERARPEFWKALKPVEVKLDALPEVYRQQAAGTKSTVSAIAERAEEWRVQRGKAGN